MPSIFSMIHKNNTAFRPNLVSKGTLSSMLTDSNLLMICQLINLSQPKIFWKQLNLQHRKTTKNIHLIHNKFLKSLIFQSICFYCKFWPWETIFENFCKQLYLVIHRHVSFNVVSAWPETVQWPQKNYMTDIFLSTVKTTGYRFHKKLNDCQVYVINCCSLIS